MRHSSINQHRTASLSVSLSLILAAALGQYNYCAAQQSNAGTGNREKPKTVKEMLSQPAPRIPARTPAANDSFSKPQILPPEKISFDDIPKYPGGAKYSTGMSYESNDGKGSTLQLVTYSVTEPKNQVKDWYMNALRMYGWNITFQSDTVINATNSKSGNVCNMQFCDSRSAKERSTLQIDYHKVNK
jgi:hypothetical protein